MLWWVITLAEIVCKKTFSQVICVDQLLYNIVIFLSAIWSLVIFLAHFFRNVVTGEHFCASSTRLTTRSGAIVDAEIKVP